MNTNYLKGASQRIPLCVKIRKNNEHPTEFEKVVLYILESLRIKYGFEKDWVLEDGLQRIINRKNPKAEIPVTIASEIINTLYYFVYLQEGKKKSIRVFEIPGSFAMNFLDLRREVRGEKNDNRAKYKKELYDVLLSLEDQEYTFMRNSILHSSYFKFLFKRLRDDLRFVNQEPEIDQWTNY